MAADAEIVLKFKAEIEEALNQIKELQKALSDMKDSGGAFGGSAEESERVSELQAQLSAYVSKVQELQAAYDSLKASGGAANEQALAQIKELSGELETAKKQINGLVDKILELQVENNKLKETAKETGKEIERTGEAGMRSYRSLRSIIGKFITDLARGKVNIQEMGTALKGLAYSTVVLGAIQLAMEGIHAATKAVTDALGANAKAAEEAAERAQSALGAAEAAATRAAEEVVKLKKEMAAQAEHDALKQAIAEQTEGYREQLRIVQEKMATLQGEAELEAHQRAMRESADKHAYAMQKLELDIRLARNEITKEEYARAKAELDFNQKMQESANKLADAKAKQAKEAKAAAAYEKEFAAAQAEADQLAADRGRYTSDSELKIQEKILEQRKAERDKISAQIDALAAEQRSIGAKGATWNPFEAYNDWKRGGEIDSGMAHLFERLEEANAQLKKTQQATEAARQSNQEYQKTSAALENATKNAEELRKKTEATKKAAQEARTAYSMLQETVSQQDAQAFELYGAQTRLTSAKREQKARDGADKSRAKDAREREKLSAEIEKLTRNAAEAAGTMGDVKDDQRAVEAVNSFLDKNADAVRRYGLDMGRLLDVAGRLRDWQTAQGSLVDKLEARLAKLEQDVKSGAQRSRNAAKNS